MAQLQPTDLKKGVVVQIDNKPFKVIDYNQKVMGRGGSIVNVRLKNLIDGSVIPKTYKGQEKVDSAEVTYQTVQYLSTKMLTTSISWTQKPSSSSSYQPMCVKTPRLI